MVLSDKSILEAIDNGDIVITPFKKENLGTNSYDVHLDKTLYIMRNILDLKEEPVGEFIEIPDEGFMLLPGLLYLANTVEYTETHKYVPYLDGKSSIGRYGLSVHQTAGRGDEGFMGFWTMELSVILPLKIYKDMPPIAQITYHTLTSEPLVSYKNKTNSSYHNQVGKPVPSKFYKKFIK